MTDAKCPSLNSIRAPRLALPMLAQSLLALTLVLTFGLKAEAQIRLAYLDYDGTIVENRQSQGGTHSTTHILFRVQEAGIHLLAGVTPGAESIEVTQQDYHKIEQYLGKGHGQPGAINRHVTLEDGRVIQPGLYFPRFPETFKFFRESREPGRNFLLEDFKKAEAKSPNGEFKGRFWHVLTSWTSSKETAERLTIITARGHSESEWKQLFEYMIQRGHIQHAPGRVINLSRHEFDRLGLPGDMPERKANFLAEQAAELARVDLPKGENHMMVIADDEQRNLERITNRLTSLANSGRYPVEFLIGNAGLRSEIRASIRPEFAKLRPEGSIKPALIYHFTPDANPESFYTNDQSKNKIQGEGPLAVRSSLVLLGRCDASFAPTGLSTGGRP